MPCRSAPFDLQPRRKSFPWEHCACRRLGATIIFTSFLQHEISLFRHGARRYVLFHIHHVCAAPCACAFIFYFFRFSARIPSAFFHWNTYIREDHKNINHINMYAIMHTLGTSKPCAQYILDVFFFSFAHRVMKLCCMYDTRPPGKCERKPQRREAFHSFDIFHFFSRSSV